MQLKRMVQRLLKIVMSSLTQSQGFWQIQTAKGLFQAETVVNCAGAWAAGIARSAGEHIFPLEAYAPMLVVTDRRPKILPAVMGVLAHTLSLKQLDTGQFVIGGGVRAKANHSINQSDVNCQNFLHQSGWQLNYFLKSQTHSHSLLVRYRGLYARRAANHWTWQAEWPFSWLWFSAHGFQLGPGVGEALADLVMGRQPRVSLEAFRPDRFIN